MPFDTSPSSYSIETSVLRMRLFHRVYPEIMRSHGFIAGVGIELRTTAKALALVERKYHKQHVWSNTYLLSSD